jgi:phospholipase A2
LDSRGIQDAGAELNIPYYPLLRREVDCIIALDASADSQVRTLPYRVGRH